MSQAINRRGFLALLPAGFRLAADTGTKKANPLPTAEEFFRFLDPTTETPVVRLTSPAHSSALPAPTNRFLTTKDRALFFSSDRTGRMCPFRADLHTRLIHQLADTSALAPASLCLDETGRWLYFLDGRTLQALNPASRKSHSIAEDVDAFAISGPGQFVIVRKQRLELLHSGAQPLAESVAPFCVVRPGGKGCLFLRETSDQEREFWYAPFGSDAATGKPALVAKGCISDPFWSPDGASVLFLRERQNGETAVSDICQAFPENGTEQRVGPTSQFAAFAPNSDATVFVGASRSKAQPTILLMLRSVRREMTLCEHRSKHPALVSPVFSPDSRCVYFQSDRDGKPALYSVNVESLVEPTNSAA